MPNTRTSLCHPFFAVPDGDYKFRYDGYRFACVLSPNHDIYSDFSLADFLSLLDVVIDDDTQFARIIRYCDWNKTTFTYRAYNQVMVQININHSNIK